MFCILPLFLKLVTYTKIHSDIHVYSKITTYTLAVFVLRTQMPRLYHYLRMAIGKAVNFISYKARKSSQAYCAPSWCNWVRFSAGWKVFPPTYNVFTLRMGY
jgi:hypothetical protein